MKIYCSRIPNNSLSKYIGKDIWVKTTWKDAFPQYWWIRVLSEIEPGVFHVNMIYDNAGSVIEDALSDYIIEEKDFTFVEPIELITTEELFEEN